MVYMIFSNSKMRPASVSRAIVSSEKFSQLQGSNEYDSQAQAEEQSKKSPGTSTKSHRGWILSLILLLTLYYP